MDNQFLSIFKSGTMDDQLEQILTSLKEELSKDESYHKFGSLIKVITEKEFRSLTDISDLAKREFEKGYSIKFVSEKDGCYYIALNFAACLQDSLTEEEIVAVLMHEYGHLLNDYKVPVGSTHKPEEILKGLAYIKEPVVNFTEYCADSYVFEEYKSFLLSALDKQFKNSLTNALYLKRREKIVKKESNIGGVSDILKALFEKSNK